MQNNIPFADELIIRDELLDCEYFLLYCDIFEIGT